MLRFGLFVLLVSVGSAIWSAGLADAAPQHVALVASGHLSGNPVDHRVTAFDADTGAELYSVPFPEDSEPGCILVHPSLVKAYVCERYNGGSPGKIAVVSLSTQAIMYEIPIPQGIVPNSLVFNSSATRLYVADWGALGGSNADGGITVVDTALDTVLNKVDMGRAWGVSISADDSVLYATHNIDDEIWVIDALLAETSPAIATLDVIPATNPEPTDIEVSPDGSRLYVSNGSSPVALNEYNIGVPASPVHTQTFGGAPVSGFIEIDPAGQYLYNSSSVPGGDVYKIDLNSHTVAATIDVDSSGKLSISSDGAVMVVPNPDQSPPTVSFVDLAGGPAIPSATLSGPGGFGGVYPLFSDMYTVSEGGPVGGIAELVMDPSVGDTQVPMTTALTVAGGIALASLAVAGWLYRRRDPAR
jgi:hypothetical protein